MFGESEDEQTPRVHYSYLRALQVEGRYPDGEGAWVITAMRLRFGEGIPLIEPQLKLLPGNKLPPVPTIPRHWLQPELFLTYRRLRSATSVERFLQRSRDVGVVIGVPLSPGWINPPNGIIPLPQSNQIFPDQTHCVALRDFLPGRRHFRFPNSWENWGLDGDGFLSYDYFDRYVFESFALYKRDNTPVESNNKQSLIPFDDGEKTFLRRVVIRTEELDRYYTFTVESSPKQRYGWALVTEREGWLDLEELYVRPEFRKRGIGSVLLDAVDSLRAKKKLPLRIFVNWSESEREDPNAFEVMCNLVARLGCSFEPCDDPRAAYIATQGSAGAFIPPSPNPYFTRPRAPRHELVIAAAILIIQTATSSVANYVSSTFGNAIPKVVATYSQSDTQTIRDALDAINPERWRLIEKKSRGSLSQTEQEKLDRLQEQSRLFADQLAPLDTSRTEELSELLSRHGVELS